MKKNKIAKIFVSSPQFESNNRQKKYVRRVKESKKIRPRCGVRW